MPRSLNLVELYATWLGLPLQIVCWLNLNLVEVCLPGVCIVPVHHFCVLQAVCKKSDCLG